MKSCWHAAAIAALVCLDSGPLRAQGPVLLREAFPAGYQYHVSTRTELEGSLSVPGSKEAAAPRALPVRGNSAIEYDERVLAAEANGVQRTLRIYRRIDFDRTVDGRPQHQSIRAQVRRLVVMRLNHVEVPFSPDGPLTWPEIDLVRTDVFTPALVGMLPERAVRPGDRWRAEAAAVQELTDLERVEDGGLECRLDEVTEGGRQARVSFRGTVRGVNEDGPNSQDLDGSFYLDLAGGYLSYLSLHGISTMLDKSGKTVGRIEGRFVLTRRPGSAPDLAGAAIASVRLEPDAENTRLLYESPGGEFRFLYPRRWRLGALRGRKVTLDEPGGSGALISLEEPGHVPTGRQFADEVRGWLAGQKAPISRSEPPRVLDAGVEEFAFEAEVGGRKSVLQYLVVRRDAGGVTIAGRLAPADAPVLRADLERVARSFEILRAPAPGR